MSTIDEVKQKLDIIEVISGYTRLQKAGKNFRALCPFHTEKTPSFYVFPEKQTWHCFGSCSVGGDVFTFIMKKDNLSFGEALKALAARAGVPLPTTPQREEAHKEKERLYGLNQQAALFYQQALQNSPARDYLAGRGVKAQTIQDFTLGYAPPQRQALHHHLQELGYSREDILASGLALEKDGQAVDLFHHRLLFPIREPGGKVAGFGGRALDESHPKYLNSPQSLVFDKGGLLYGLDRAREAIRRLDRAVIVEGYMDVIITHQEGSPEVVATMGLALSEKHLTLLKRFSRNIILALDADVAGAQALFRGVTEVALPFQAKTPPPDWNLYVGSLDTELRVLVLPPGKDPDEVILGDREGWQQRLAQAPPAMDYLLQGLVSTTDLGNLRAKEALVARLRPLFQALEGSVRWAHYLQKLSRAIMVEERVLASALRSSHRSPESGRTVPLPSRGSLERYCLALILHYPALGAQARELSPDYFEEGQHQEIFRAWQGGNGDLETRLEPPLREYLQVLMSQPVPEDERLAQEKLVEFVMALKRRHLLRQLEAEKEELTSLDRDKSLQRLQEMGTEINLGLKSTDPARKSRRRD